MGDIGSHFKFSGHSITRAGYFLSSLKCKNKTRQNEYHEFFIHLRRFDLHHAWIIMDYGEFKLLHDALGVGGGVVNGIFQLARSDEDRIASVARVQPGLHPGYYNKSLTFC